MPMPEYIMTTAEYEQYNPASADSREEDYDE